MNLFILFIVSAVVFAAAVEVLGVATAVPGQNCDGLPAGTFTPVNISSPSGNLIATIIPYGATMTHLFVRDKQGELRDVLLGFDDPKTYCNGDQHPYFGATVGRVANRMTRGSFSLNNKTYRLPLNENSYDNLHSGPMGFDRQAFSVKWQTATDLYLHYTSPDGDGGFPSPLELIVRFTVGTANHNNKQDVLFMSWNGTNVGSEDTLFNPTFHGYFNLDGFKPNSGDGTVLDHFLTMPGASATVAVDEHLLPTGQTPSVDAQPWMDFRKQSTIGKYIKINTSSPLPSTGYDTAFVMEKTPGWNRAMVTSPFSGITMQVSGDRDSYQVYSGGYLDGTIPRKATQHGGFYQQFSGVTFETQCYPDVINHPEWWGKTDDSILKPGMMEYNLVITFDTAMHP
eukprot:PhM_4_TR4471/c0_g1_i1/m.86731/K01785/galM, GALM; aldose 1-epimerase